MTDPTDCRAQIGELAKRILDEAGDEHTPDPGAKPVGSAQPLAAAVIAAPGPGLQAGGAFEAADALASERAYAQTLGHMLRDLIMEEDESPDELDVNDPASRPQRIYAVLEALQGRLAAIAKTESKLRQASRISAEASAA
jgi:hypothetical protein